MTVRRSRPLRGAIVGFGNVAALGHVPAWQSDRRFSILAVCDPDESRLAKAAELLPDARRYTDLNELLDQERLDFVDVATPPASHPAIVTAALTRRLHVLCEKPLALHPDDCGRIRSAAFAARAVVFTVHNWKYAPLFRTLKRVLRRGDIGQVTHMRLETLRMEPPGSAAGGAPWRLDPAIAGGGILVDHGWHAFSLALHALEREPLAATARTTQRKFTLGTAEDTAECTVEFPGATVEIFLTWAAHERSNRGRLVGEHGTIEIADRQLVVTAAGRAPVVTAFANALSAGSYHPDWFGAMLDDFFLEIVESKERGLNLREAEACCRLIELCYRSSAAGGSRLTYAEQSGLALPEA